MIHTCHVRSARKQARRRASAEWPAGASDKRGSGPPFSAGCCLAWPSERWARSWSTAPSWRSHCHLSLPSRSVPNAQCPMPNAQCPVSNAQCPMPNAQCPMPTNTTTARRALPAVGRHHRVDGGARAGRWGEPCAAAQLRSRGGHVWGALLPARARLVARTQSQRQGAAVPSNKPTTGAATQATNNPQRPDHCAAGAGP